MNLHFLSQFRWKMQEACLKAIGYVSDDFLLAIQDSKVNFDLSGLFEHVVFNHIAATGKHDLKSNYQIKL